MPYATIDQPSWKYPIDAVRFSVSGALARAALRRSVSCSPILLYFANTSTVPFPAGIDNVPPIPHDSSGANLGVKKSADSIFVIPSLSLISVKKPWYEASKVP